MEIIIILVAAALLIYLLLSLGELLYQETMNAFYRIKGNAKSVLWDVEWKIKLMRRK